MIQTHNTKDASYFLDRLHGKDSVMMFQTFDDNPTVKDPSLARVIVSTFDDAMSTLQDLNRKGAGIFVAVNKLEGQQRRIKNVVAINTLFIESDKGAVENLPIDPTMVVESSPGKFHYYFKLTNPNQNVEEFRPVMQTLVKSHGSDPNATDLTRVLRIPGFFHLKNDPFLVRITQPFNNTYMWSELTRAFPPQPLKRPSPKDPSTFRIIPQTTKVVDALSFLNPECSRYDWIATIASLHNAYQGSDQGLDIAIRWSRGEFKDTYNGEAPANYAGDDDIVYNWNSFTESTTAPRTIGSLFFAAKEAGWESNPLNRHSVTFVTQEQEDVLKKINDTYGVVLMPGGGSRVVRRNWSNGRYVFESDRDMKLALSGIEAPTIVYDKRKASPEPVIKYVPAFDIWLNSPNKLRFKNTMFHPLPNLYYDKAADDKETIIVDPASPEVLNTYYGTYIHPVYPTPHPTNPLLKPVLDLIYNAAANQNPEAYEYILNWIAHTVQFPTRKTELMMIFMGEKGTGKSMLAYLIKGLHEPYTYKTAAITDLLEGFNNAVMESTLIVAEEATWGGDRSHDSKLKDFITCQRATRKQKYISDESNVPVYHNIVATANPGFAVPEGNKKSERRYLTLSFNPLYKNDMSFFAQFGYEETTQREEVLANFKAFLLSRDLSRFVPTKLPTNLDSPHAANNRMESAGIPFHFLHNAIDDDGFFSSPSSQSSGKASKIGQSVAFTDVIAMNDMWNSLDPTESKFLISSSTFKNLFRDFKTQSPSHKLGVSALYNYLETNHFPIQQRVNPTQAQITKYPHLTAGSKYVEIPNRLHTLKLFVEELGILDRAQYKEELELLNQQEQEQGDSHVPSN